jgi:hypothetical protein
VVIVVSTIDRRRIKGNLVVGRRIGETFLQQACDIVVEVESYATAATDDGV